jgi:hypothetical protein
MSADRRPFTASEDARIRELVHLGIATDAEIAQALGRSPRAVTRRRQALGLMKLPDETLAKRRATLADVADPPPQPGVTIHRCR